MILTTPTIDAIRDTLSGKNYKLIVASRKQFSSITIASTISYLETMYSTTFTWLEDISGYASLTHRGRDKTAATLATLSNANLSMKIFKFR